MSAKTTNVAADGSLAQASLGPFQYFFVRAMSHPVEVSFDGTQWAQLNLNDRLTLPQKPTRVYFRALNGLASIVTYQYSITPFDAQDTAVSLAETFMLGNCGIPDGTAAAGGKPQSLAAGVLVIPDAMMFLISGKYNGNRRQKIIFSVTTNSPGALQVLDPNGITCIIVSDGQVIALDTDSDLYVSGTTAGDAHASIGQIFLAS